jgi:CMP-N,N'-diacetyllegionaminic acid synthase
MIIHSIIPCRSGSKGILNKNIKIYKNKPLISHSIELSLKCNYINKTIISTDSKEYGEIGEKYGGLLLYIRPIEISLDLSTDYEFINYHINWLKENNEEIPDYIIQLRPTYPNRKIEILNKCIELMINNKEYDSLRTVVKIDKSPYKMYNIENNKLIPLFTKYKDFNEPYNLPRQELPECYLHNGYIDIIKTSTIINKKSITGDLIYPYIMDSVETYDIDTHEDWEKSELKITWNDIINTSI